MHFRNTDLPIPLRPTMTVVTDSSTSMRDLRQHLVSREGESARRGPGSYRAPAEDRVHDAVEGVDDDHQMRLMTMDFVVVRPSSIAPPWK